MQLLIGQRQAEEALLAEADRRGQADIAAAQERAEQELMAALIGEHRKLSRRQCDGHDGQQRNRRETGDQS